MSFLSGVCLDDFLSIIAPKPGGGKRKYPDSRLVPPVGSVPTRVFVMGPAGPVGAATCRPSLRNLRNCSVGAATCRPSLRNLRIFLRMGIPLPVNTSAILRKWVVRKPVRCYHEHEKLNVAEMRLPLQERSASYEKRKNEIVFHICCRNFDPCHRMVQYIRNEQND